MWLNVQKHRQGEIIYAGIASSLTVVCSDCCRLYPLFILEVLGRTCRLTLGYWNQASWGQNRKDGCNRFSPEKLFTQSNWQKRLCRFLFPSVIGGTGSPSGAAWGEPSDGPDVAISWPGQSLEETFPNITQQSTKSSVNELTYWPTGLASFHD